MIIKSKNKSQSLIMLTIIFGSIIIGGLLINQNQPTESNIKDTEGGSEDLVSPQPKIQTYGDHIENPEIGSYIVAPNYFECYSGQSNNYLSFRLRDYYGQDYWNFYSDYKIYLDHNYNSPYNTGNVAGSSELNIYVGSIPIGVHALDVMVKHDALKKWIIHNATLNMTTASHSLYPFYTNFDRNLGGTGSLEWAVNLMPGHYYNYYMYVDGALVYSQASVNYYWIYLDYYYVNLNSVGTRQIRILVVDDWGFVSENKFNITVTSSNYPWIDEFKTNDVKNNNRFQLYETQNANLVIRAQENANDLKRIDVFIMAPIEGRGEFPLLMASVKNAIKNTRYEVPIQSEIIDNLNMTDIRFRAIAINRYGKYGISQDLPLFVEDNYALNEAVKRKANVYMGRNVEKLNFTDPEIKDLSFEITVVIDVNVDTKISLFAMSANRWKMNGGNDQHCRDPDNNCQIWQVFEEINHGGYYFSAGVVFWIDTPRIDAIQFPILVNVKYPDAIEPNPDFDEPPLRLLHWKNDWTSFDNPKWQRTDQDEIKNVGENEVEFNIYELGLYGYGMDSKDYRDGNQNQNGIPGYFIMILLVSSLLGIGILLKSRKNLKKQ